MISGNEQVQNETSSHHEPVLPDKIEHSQHVHFDFLSKYVWRNDQLVISLLHEVNSTGDIYDVPVTVFSKD